MNIVVELAPEARRLLQDAADQPVGAAVRRLLDDLVEDLGLPQEVELELSSAGPGPTDNGSHQVAVDGQRCRQPVAGRAGELESPRALARSIIATIYENRELLIGDEVVDRWRAALAADGVAPASPEPDVLRGALAELVRRHCSVDVTIAAELSRAEDAGWTGSSQQLVEAVLSRRERYGVEAHVPVARLQADASLDLLREIADPISEELGLIIPPVDVVVDESLEDDEFRTRVNDLRTPPMQVPLQGSVLVALPQDVADLLDVPAVAVSSPLPGTHASAIPDTDEARQAIGELGLEPWPPTGHLALHVLNIARRNAGDFLTTDLVRFYLRALQPDFPALVERARAAIGIEELTRTLRALLDEGVSIHDLRSILEALLALDGVVAIPETSSIVLLPAVWPPCPTPGPLPSAATGHAMATCVRPWLHRFVVDGNGRVPPLFLLDHALEERLGQVGQRPLSDQEHRQLVTAVASAVGAPSWLRPNPALVTSMLLRRLLQRLIDREIPWLRVMAWEELPPGRTPDPEGTVDWGAEPEPAEIEVD
jgi:hypothetical protein